MSNMKVRWNLRAFRELRTLPTMQALVGQYAQDVASKANAGESKGYVAEVTANPRIRARAAVIAAGARARNDNAKHQTLVRVASGGAR